MDIKNHPNYKAGVQRGLRDLKTGDYKQHSDARGSYHKMGYNEAKEHEQSHWGKGEGNKEGDTK